MASGFPGFPFSHNTSPSSSSSSLSSAPSFGSPPLFRAPSSPSYGSFSSPFGSSSSNGFTFPTPLNSSPNNDETTINKILEAIEILENLAKNGAFPHEKLEEIKKELEKKYPNIFSNQKPGKNNTNNNNNNPFNTNSSNTLPNNDPFGWESYYSNILNQQQEFFKNYQVVLQQQVNQQVQAQNQMMEHYMKMYSTSGMFSPNYFGNNFNYPNYNTSGEAWKMAFEMMGKASNDGLFNNLMGNSTGSFGTDGFSALSFLGSLLGGGFGF